MTTDLTRTLIVLAALAAGTVDGHAQAPAAPTLLVQSRDWGAFASQGGAKTCYAISKPQKMDPATLDHGTVFFFVTTKVAEKIQNEPSLQVGYSFKEGSSVTVDVDGQKFSLFTKADGAWLASTQDEAALIAAMRKGRQLVAQGASRRGNATTYTFSLGGISAALDAVAKECK
jgi:invasion protein IalB